MFACEKLVPASEVFPFATSRGIAVGAFNFSNMETVQAIVAAANGMDMPVILQASSSAIKYMGFAYLKAIVSAAATEATMPLVLHLDHGKDFATCKECIDEGFSSVMIDASSLEYDENVAKTREVVEYAKRFGVSVEAELGTLAGVEDEVKVAEGAAFYTDPAQAADFIEHTGITSLAIAIGTSHGANKGRTGNPKLSIETLKEIKKHVGDFPLVLHGASSVYPDEVSTCNAHGAELNGAFGITDADIIAAIQNGVRKVNVDTDIRIAFLGAIRKHLDENKTNIDMRKYLTAARAAAQNVVMRRMKTFVNAH